MLAHVAAEITGDAELAGMARAGADARATAAARIDARLRPGPASQAAVALGVSLCGAR